MREVFNTPDIFSDYYTEEEVAGFLGITVRTLRNRISQGVDHPPVIIGVHKFHKESFARWLKAREKKQEGSRSNRAS